MARRTRRSSASSPGLPVSRSGTFESSAASRVRRRSSRSRASIRNIWSALFSNRMDLQRIQEALRRQKLDGWLFFDHHERDPLAYRVLGFQPPRHVTRRWYYLIPANGEPRGLVHRIEGGVIDALPGEKLKYSSWREQHAGLAR